MLLLSPHVVVRLGYALITNEGLEVFKKLGAGNGTAVVGTIVGKTLGIFVGVDVGMIGIDSMLRKCSRRTVTIVVKNKPIIAKEISFI